MTTTFNTNGQRLQLSDDDMNDLAKVVGFTSNQLSEDNIEDTFAGAADDDEADYSPHADDIAAAIAAAQEADWQAEQEAVEPTTATTIAEPEDNELDDEAAYFQQQEQELEPILHVFIDDDSYSPTFIADDEAAEELEDDEEDGNEASLAAVAPQAEQTSEGTGTINISSDFQEEAADEEDLHTDPRRNRTKVTLINSPVSQMVLVGGGMLLVILAIGGTLSLLTAQRNEAPKIAQAPTPETGIDGKPIDGEGTEATQYGIYKTEAAIGQQKELLRGKPQPQPSVTPSPVQSPAAKQPAPSPVALPPVPMPVVAPVMPTATAEKPTLEDSVRTWQLLSSVGSYGRVPTSGGSSNTSSRIIATASTSPLFSTPPVATTPVVTPVVAAASGSGMSIQQLRTSSSVPGMRDRPLVPVLVGSNTKGQLGTAIVLAGDNSSPVDPTNARSTKYLVQLTEPLKDADGAIALPIGAILVTAVRNFSPTTGRAELQAVAVIAHNREYKLPDGAVIVRAADGGTLALKQSGGGGAKFFQTVLPALLNGLSQAGQAMNQPTSSSTVSSGSVTTSVSNSKDPNLAAAFASGTANTLAQQLTQQVQAANQAASQQQKAWAISAGTQVQVFVNSTFEL